MAAFRKKVTAINQSKGHRHQQPNGFDKSKEDEEKRTVCELINLQKRSKLK